MRYDPPSHSEFEGAPRPKGGGKRILAAVLFLAASGALLAYALGEGIPDIVPRERLIVPDGGSFLVRAAGGHTVYHEYNSVVNGTTFSSGTSLLGLACSLTSPAGSEVPLTEPSSSSSYSDDVRGFAGESIFVFDATGPGLHDLRCEWTNGTTPRSIVLAIEEDATFLRFFALFPAAVLGLFGLVFLVTGIAARLSGPENL